MTNGQVAYEAAMAQLSDPAVHPAGPAWHDLVTALTWESTSTTAQQLWEAIAQAVLDAQPAP